ncbi:MAG TPA: GatB/YqeY domain-containing protein [Actinomycetes bacterium]|nr:GatB/YqeY domain-containing protein [Actinomycetes bacterium]
MLIDDVQQAMFTAMKGRQARETAALRLALASLKSAAIDARGELSDEQAVAVLQREARKRREAEQVYRDAGRAEQADQEAYERSVLERFLPAGLDPAELSRLVDEAVAASGASGPKELGKVMGRLMPQVKGRADGNEVRRLVLERLGGGSGELSAGPPG